MQLPIYVLDPTSTDEASKVRGIGRYLELLRDYLPPEVHFVTNLDTVTYNSLVIHPFYNFLQPPHAYTRKARYQLTVIHDLIPHKYPEHFPYGLKGLANIILNTFVLRNYEGVITDSKVSAEDIHTMVKYPKAGIHIVYPCASKKFLSLLKAYKRPEKPLHPKPFVIYVGDATWNKNLVNIAKAVKQADVDAIFIGKNFIPSKMAFMLKSEPENPWLDELHNFYKEIDGDARFHLKGFITDELLVQYYHEAVANLLLSRDEGFGFSTLEAGLCGTPSILGDTGIGREIGGDTALYADPENPDEIAKAIVAIQDTKIRAEKKALLPVHLKTFSPEQFADGMKQLLDHYSRDVK